MKRTLLTLAGTALLSLALGSSAGAEMVSIDRNIGYNKRVDPITDVNTSYILMFEVNDTNGDTGFTVRCAEDDKPNTWGYFFGKNQVMPYDPEDAEQRIWPDVVVRLGTDAPFDVPGDDLYNMTDDTTGLALDGKTLDRIVAGLIAGKKLVMRVSGPQFRQPLTYTFSAQKFNTAWNGVKACK